MPENFLDIGGHAKKKKNIATEAKIHVLNVGVALGHSYEVQQKVTQVPNSGSEILNVRLLFGHWSDVQPNLPP